MSETPSTPEADVLCEDVPIGRFGVWTWVSVDVALYRRHTSRWGGGSGVVWLPGRKARFRGAFWELSVECRIRRYLPWRTPSRYVPGFPNLDQLTWSTPGVRVADLVRLAELAAEYRPHLITVETAERAAVNEVVLMPSAVEQEVREIAARLAATRKGRR